MFLNPRMSDEQLAEYYSTNLYREVVFGNDRDKYEDDLVDQQLRADLHFAMLKNVDPEFPGRSSLLEIGCSAGYLLKKVQDNGGVTTGVEPDPTYRNMVKENKRCPLVVEYLDRLVPYPYSFIVMSHVLEHLNHPVEYMTDLIKNYTLQGTHILIEVPNAEVNRSALQCHHQFAFSPFTFNNFLHRVGLQQELISMHGLVNTTIRHILVVCRIKEKK